MPKRSITSEFLADPCERVILSPYLQRAERDLANTPCSSAMTSSCQRDAMRGLVDLLHAEVDETLKLLCARKLAKENPIWALDPRLAPESAVADVRQRLAQDLQESELAAVDEAAPLLRSVLDHQTRRFTAATVELCERIWHNRSAMAQELFGTLKPGRLTAISSQMGDTHNGGRRTMVIACEAGRFVYKPHDCRIDVWFADVAEYHLHGTFAQPHTIACEDANGAWGIQQYLERQAVLDKSGLARYWYNMGRAIALFQALGSEDLHCENFVAVGEHPSLIDVETVLTSEPAVLGDPLSIPNLNGALSDFEHDVTLTLVKSGLMPSPLGKENNSSPLLARGYHCLPVLDDAERDVRGYEDELLAGFNEGLAMLAERREELARDVRRAASIPVRGLVRNTQLYARLLRRLQRPDAFSTAKREELLDQLRAPLANGDASVRLDLVTSEISCLREGDIPYFYAAAGSHTVEGSDGTSCPHALKGSAVERALVRIEALDEAHCTFDQEVLGANLRRAYLPSDTSIPPRNPSASSLCSGEAITAAEEAFWDLEKLILKAPSEEASWLFRNAKYGILMSSTVAMADGLGGVAVFLAALAPRTRNGRIRERALLRLNSYLTRVDDALVHLQKAQLIPATSIPLGLASGIGGVVRSLDYMARELGSHDGFDGAARRATSLLERLVCVLEHYDIEHAQHTDVYEGLSGLLLALGACKTTHDDPRAHAVAERLARRLLELRSLTTKDGTMLWRTCDAKWPISGFGHGQAGIAAALATATASFGVDAADAIQDALAWEAQAYHEKLGSWPDLRQSPVPTTCMHGICSGAPGIGLAALVAARLEDASTRKLAWTLLERADHACRALAPPSRDTLCCGGLAVVEYLLSRNLRTEAERLIAGMVARKHMLGDYVFVHDGMRLVAEPDLFDGLSGVGYTLLRYADPTTRCLFTL